MNDQDPPDQWTVFGNTLYLGTQGAPYIAFPGDMATAQQIAAAHNQAITLTREQGEARAAALRAAARNLVNVLTTLRYPDESTIWRLGGTLLEQDYQTLKATLDTTQNQE